MKSLVVLMSVCVCCIHGAEFVKPVKQNYKEETNTAVVDQIQRELYASYVYQAYASYFQRADVSLPGIQKFFSEASTEERDHAQMLIDYVNKRGGHAQFKELKLEDICATIRDYAAKTKKNTTLTTETCICNFVGTKNKVTNTDCGDRSKWHAGLMGFEDALIIERFVNEKIVELHEKAENAGDAHLTHILEHHFLEEQVASIYSLAQYVTRLRSFPENNYKLGEYIFDQNLK